jgi:hypothetical protein
VDTDQECFVANSALIWFLKKFNYHLKPDIKSVARREELASDFPPVLKN